MHAMVTPAENGPLFLRMLFEGSFARDETVGFTLNRKLGKIP